MLIITRALMIIITDFPFVYKTPRVTDPGTDFFTIVTGKKTIFFLLEFGGIC